jgi:predicted transport protein
MSDIKLFKLNNGKADELYGNASDLEKPLQTLIETNLESLLGIRFLATEYSTGKTHAGRIDSLGIDENHSPVILEYKRSSSENVINQGLFYLDWLMDHQAEFELLVMKSYGKQASDLIDWSQPRLVCIAADFTKYDGHAVQQMNRNIELIRYRQFGKELLLLELVNATSATNHKSSNKIGKPKSNLSKNNTGDRTYAEWLELIDSQQQALLSSMEDYMISLGDDVQRKELKLYVAFKRIKNFASIIVQKNKLILMLSLNPQNINPLPSNARDVTSIGHWGTGNLEITINGQEDFEQAKPLILMAYEGRV